MKRQLTALLLAMTFVLATVSPTLAAKPAKESGNRTATVSVEKPRKEKSRVGAFFGKLASPFTALFTTSSEVASDKKTNTDPKPEGTQPKDANHQSADPNPVTPNPQDTPTGGEGTDKGNKETEDEFKKAKFAFSLINESKEELTKAKFQIVRKDVEPKQIWDDKDAKSELDLEPGNYEFKLAEKLDGYKMPAAIEFNIGKSGVVTLNGEELTKKDKYLLTMTIKKEESKTFFGIRDIHNSELAGAELKIVEKPEKNESGEITTAKIWNIPKTPGEQKLPEGKYELTYTKLPDGYKLEKESIEFEVDKDGKIKVAEADEKYLDKKDGNETLFLKADPLEKQIIFKLKDSTGRDIFGPELQIKDSHGKVVATWFSEKTWKAIAVKDLPDGDYEFSQTTVPYGYTAAEPIRFTVKTVEKEKIVKANYGHTDFGPYQELALVSKNAKRVVTFSRVDVSGKALLGNEIEIYKDGIKIASWKSGSDSTKLELEPGVYKYHEASAATGHKVAKDFDFEMKADGTVTLNNVQAGENVKLKEGGLIVVGESAGAPVEDPNKKPETKPADKPGQGKTKGSAQVQNVWVEFSIANKSGVELSGATVEILQNGKSVASWTTSTTSYKVKLQPGSYRFHTKTAPQGYQLARDFNFAVNRDGSIALGKIQSGDTVAAKDGKITVYGDPVTATGARATGTSQGTQANNGKLPKTGDGISPVVYAAGLAAVGAVVLGIGIKKRRQSVDEIK